VYVYDKAEQEFLLAETISAPDLTRLGVSLALSEGTLAMGSLQGASVVTFETVSLVPTTAPSIGPTASPTIFTSAAPSVAVTASPSVAATASPSATPTAGTTPMPTRSPTTAAGSPTMAPTAAAQVAFTSSQVIILSLFDIIQRKIF
jgi:hypothetical protein